MILIAKGVTMWRKNLSKIAFGAVVSLLPGLAASESHHVVAVAGSEHVALHGLATGAELARFDARGGTNDLAALPNGLMLVNLGGANQVLILDAERGAEIGRIPSSSLGGTNPVHTYLTPLLDGKQFAVVLNDGEERRTKPGERPDDSTMLFIDVVPTSPTYLKAVGEVRLGRGHHKAGFSTTRPRLAVSNIADCTDVISVFDFSQATDIRLVKTFAATDLGYDGSSPIKTCDNAGKAGMRLSPHGTGTSGATGHVYHYLTGTGQIAIFDVDAEVPTVKLLQTTGAGGAAVKDVPGGQFMIVPQRGPRELHLKFDGAPCQIGQLVIVNAVDQRVAAQVPGFYGDPACRSSLAGTPNERAALQYAMPSPDGRTVFVSVGTVTGPPGRLSEGRFIAAFDITDPYRPLQLPSIPVGGGDASRALVMTGDGKMLVVPNVIDNTVTIVDVATRTPIRTFSSINKARLAATFSHEVGPSKPVGPASGAAKH
jgi:DNA-binding beta-propeller fold protein YncE